jgi:hypothetical protein
MDDRRKAEMEASRPVWASRVCEASPLVGEAESEE